GSLGIHGKFTASNNGSTYNAISSNGSVAFFTGNCRGVAQLFAWQNATQVVPISEPSVADWVPCKEESPSPASFQGASADGSRVFFLSNQQLLPGAQPGTNLYEYDFAAAEPDEKVSLIATHLVASKGEMAGVARVSEDGSRVYLVSSAVLAGNEN